MKNEMKTEIHLGASHVTIVQNNANLIFGEARLSSWRTHSKSNAAMGRFSGDKNIFGSRANIVNDMDILDTTIRVRNKQ